MPPPPHRRSIALRLLAATLIAACPCTIGQAATHATAKLRPETIAYWQRIHQCEQPDAWSHQQFPQYKGGLGMSNGAWTWWAGELGLLALYANAGYAPPIVQIRVADYGWRRHRGSWGCMRTVGYPPG